MIFPGFTVRAILALLVARLHVLSADFLDDECVYKYLFEMNLLDSNDRMLEALEQEALAIDYVAAISDLGRISNLELAARIENKSDNRITNMVNYLHLRRHIKPAVVSKDEYSIDEESDIDQFNNLLKALGQTAIQKISLLQLSISSLPLLPAGQEFGIAKLDVETIRAWFDLNATLSELFAHMSSSEIDFRSQIFDRATARSLMIEAIKARVDEAVFLFNNASAKRNFVLAYYNFTNVIKECKSGLKLAESLEDWEKLSHERNNAFGRLEASMERYRSDNGTFQNAVFMYDAVSKQHRYALNDIRPKSEHIAAMLFKGYNGSVVSSRAAQELGLLSGMINDTLPK